MKKQILSALLTFSLALTLLPAMAVNQASITSSYLSSGSKDLPKLTPAEIVTLLEENPLTLPENVFEEEPSYTTPYKAGKIKDEALQAALNRLNALRRLAGLPGAMMDDEYNNIAQHGAVLLATWEFSHYPSKPDDMAEDFYKLARNAAETSNIYPNLSLTNAVDGFMNDSDSGNIVQLGHRMWQLNPKLGKVGFGYARYKSEKTGYNGAMTEKITDSSGPDVDYDFVGWPASGNFPSTVFKSNIAWSISLNTKNYTKPERSDIIVNLTRLSDGTVWTFNGAETYSSRESKYFNLSNYNIIFRPDITGPYQGVYRVEVNGLKDASGKPVDFSYQVNFFDPTATLLDESMFTVDINDEIYDSQAKTKSITGQDGSTSLVADTDYSVSYTNNTEVGTATIFIIGIGKYSGTLTYEFKINPQPSTDTSSEGSFNISGSISGNGLSGGGIPGGSISSSGSAIPKKPGPTVSTSNTAVGGQTVAGPSATINGDTAITEVSQTMGKQIVEQAVKNSSTKVVISPKITTDVTKTAVSIPAETVGNIGSQTKASLTVSTPVANVSIANEALSGLSSTGNQVTVSAQKVDNSVTLEIAAGGEAVTALPGGIILTIPHQDCKPGTVAVLVHKDGTREVVRQSVANDKTLTIDIPLAGSATLEIVENSKTFKDVSDGNWHKDAADFASSHEFFSGTSETTFSPDLPMSRGMLATVLYRMESEPDQAVYSVFNDVNTDTYYATPIQWAADKGIVSGYGDGSFGADDPITREQLAVMLWRYAGSTTVANKELNFTDADEAGSFALDALSWAVENHVISGYDDGRLNPKGEASRAQVAQMLMNFLKR